MSLGRAQHHSGPDAARRRVGRRTVLCVFLFGTAFPVWRTLSPTHPERQSASPPRHEIAQAAREPKPALLAPDRAGLPSPEPSLAATTPAAAVSGTDGSIPPELMAACAEPDAERRSARIEAALRAWAGCDVDAAGAWAHGQEFIARAVALAAVVNGAATASADSAEHYVERISDAQPANAVEYGGFLIHALGETGAHARAATWAARADRPVVDWLVTAFDRWGQADAPAAWTAAAQLENAESRRIAMHAALNAWAKRHPAELAETAAQFPAGPEKNYALLCALRAWAEIDPQKTAEWMLARRDALSGVPQIELVLED